MEEVNPANTLVCVCVCVMKGGRGRGREEEGVQREEGRREERKGEGKVRRERGVHQASCFFALRN